MSEAWKEKSTSGTVYDNRAAILWLCGCRGGVEITRRRLTNHYWNEHHVPVKERRGRAWFFRRLAENLDQHLEAPDLLKMPFLLDSFASSTFKGEAAQRVALTEFKLRAWKAGLGSTQAALFGLEQAEDVLRGIACESTSRDHRLARASLDLHIALYKAVVPDRPESLRKEHARRGIDAAASVTSDILAHFSDGDIRNGSGIFAAKIAVNYLHAQELRTGTLAGDASKLVLNHHVWEGINSVAEWIGDPRLLVNTAEAAASSEKHEMAAGALSRMKKIARYSGKLRDWRPVWIPPTEDGRPYFQTIPVLQTAVDMVDCTNQKECENEKR